MSDTLIWVGICIIFRLNLLSVFCGFLYLCWENSIYHVSPIDRSSWGIIVIVIVIIFVTLKILAQPN